MFKMITVVGSDVFFEDYRHEVQAMADCQESVKWGEVNRVILIDCTTGRVLFNEKGDFSKFLA